MIEFDTWLDEMNRNPLPGGVAAAAVAAAMGAALVAKGVRVTLKHRSLEKTDRIFLQQALEEATDQATVLMSLVTADTEAFRAVLDRRDQGSEFEAKGQVWLEATEVPVRVAEACQKLLDEVPGLLEFCWPAVLPDVKTGEWLLETGKRAGLLSARTNLRLLGDTAGTAVLRERIQDLDDGRDD